MTMHLVRGLTTAGKKQGKQKWASAEQKRRAEELDREWAGLQDKWASKSVKPALKPASKIPTYTHRDSNRKRIASVDSNVQGAVTTSRTPTYTGDKMIGITVLHKSCLQPVFSQQEAIDAAKMRR